MVMSATSLTGSGVRDWLVQRITAVIVLLYVLTMIAFFICHPHPTYSLWHGFFSMLWVKVFSILTFGALLFHAWVGIWTVVTDYIKCACLRLLLHAVVVTGLTGSFLCALIIFGRVG